MASMYTYTQKSGARRAHWYTEAGAPKRHRARANKVAMGESEGEVRRVHLGQVGS
jgi:hypothetical protein